MTPDQVEAREHSFVSFRYAPTNPRDYISGKFIVGTPKMREAQRLAVAYLRALHPEPEGYWDEPYQWFDGSTSRTRLAHVQVYTRNYLPRSRALLQQGRYIDADGTLGPGLIQELAGIS